MANQYTCIKTTVDILHSPEAGPIIGKQSSQLLFGERFDIKERHGPFLFGTSIIDGYEGYVHESGLSDKISNPTHIISVRLSHVYPDPDFKTRPLYPLSFLSRLSPDTSQGKNGFVFIPEFGWVFKKHLQPIEKQNKNRDPVDTALTFLGAPYLYGGRSSLGLDCAALVQLLLLSKGLDCPRDSNQQEPVLGTPVDIQHIRRGDIVFFKGHVGIMTDSTNILNATARTMDTRIETLDDLAEFYGGITSIKRLSHQA